MKRVLTVLCTLLLTTSFSFAISPIDGTDSDKKLDLQPELIYQVVPEYPIFCKYAGIEGKTIVKAFVNKEGVVDEAELLVSSGNVDLDESAMNAVLKFKFKPGIVGDKPTSAWVSIPIQFKLDCESPHKNQTAKSEIMPEIVTMTQPDYPPDAKRAGKEGSVWVKALVSKEGKVLEATIEKSDCKGFGFEEAALKAAKLNLYKPAIKNNKPESVWVTYKVVFKLDDH